MPMPNGPLAALEGRASGAIGSIMGYFRRDDGVVWKQTRAPLVDALETPRVEFAPVRRGDKKRAVPAVGRTVLLPRNVDSGGVN
ncbi:hypothetical protein KVR01_004658 [Diaporthe batatas]|uniref:uncharacterized protein n=1 Tax=Diaporthe batatas TaxID=748121 RepID=UPI001D05348F|nr:uncharacterized protein KVR01_004658 [Diaporthe batatas]KAG8166106.1 hypothetical protein KVR01_004658 [Diaporthe batatas]